MCVRGCHAREFLLNHVSELTHLALHLDHFFAHVQDDFYSREVYTHVARQRQDYIQALQVGICIQACVSLRARWLQQSYAFVETQRLRVQFVKLGHCADHIAGFGPFFCSRRHRASYTPAFVNKSLRGSPGATVSSSFIRVRTRSSVGAGTTT
jgi:hypothetical protein